MNAMKPGYYALIPAEVRYDKTLSSNAKLLYGEITAHIGMGGYCCESKHYFADILGVSAASVIRLLSKLEKSGHIVRKIVNGKEVIICGRISR